MGPWWSPLPPETLQQLVGPDVDLEQLAFGAIRDPRYAAAFKRLGVRVETYDDYRRTRARPSPGHVRAFLPPKHFPRLVIPAGAEGACAALVAKWALGGEQAADKDDLVAGLPYMKADYERAGKLHRREKMTVEGIKKRSALSTSRAFRIYRQFKAGAVVYDEIGLRPGPGYRWDPVGLDNDPPRYKLIRA